MAFSWAAFSRTLRSYTAKHPTVLGLWGEARAHLDLKQVHDGVAEDDDTGDGHLQVQVLEAKRLNDDLNTRPCLGFY